MLTNNSKQAAEIGLNYTQKSLMIVCGKDKLPEGSDRWKVTGCGHDRERNDRE